MIHVILLYLVRVISKWCQILEFVCINIIVRISETCWCSKQSYGFFSLFNITILVNLTFKERYSNKNQQRNKIIVKTYYVLFSNYYLKNFTKDSKLFKNNFVCKHLLWTTQYILNICFLVINILFKIEDCISHKQINSQRISYQKALLRYLKLKQRHSNN